MENNAMTNQCECGHELSDHTWINRSCVASSGEDDVCPCTGYRPKAEPPEPKHTNCVVPLSSNTCVYLADGNKVIIRRDGQRAWLEVVAQDIIVPMSAEPKASPSLEDAAYAYIDNDNPFVKGRPEIVMRKNWLMDFMVGFARQQRRDAVAEFIERYRTSGLGKTLTEIAKEMSDE